MMKILIAKSLIADYSLTALLWLLSCVVMVVISL